MKSIQNGEYMFLSDAKNLINEKGYLSVSDFRDFKDFRSFCSDHNITTNPLLPTKPKIEDASVCLCPKCGGFKKVLIMSMISGVVQTDRNLKFSLWSCDYCNSKGLVGWTERIVRNV